MLERTEGKHQYKGMSVERLRYLANLLEEDAGWKFTSGAGTTLTYSALITIIVTQLGITAHVLMKLKMLATETRDLRRRVREHDLLLGVAARVTRV